MGNGSVTQNIKTRLDGSFAQVTLSWLSATDGSLDATALETAIAAQIFGMYLVEVITVPGGRAPTGNYDITITDEYSIDLMGGKLANRSASAGEAAIPLYFSRPVIGTLYLNLTNNITDRAQGTVILLFSKYPVSTGLTS